ncbi:MAG: MFS transporter [Fimbriimonadales bacterium]|nr:MAG: MFS transporter [Fimbriimonadales bacterium]
MPTETDTQQAARWTARWALAWIALVAFLDTFAIVPVLAPYTQRALGATDAQAGLVLSLYSLANLLANFYSGVIIDRLGRRLPMSLSLFAAGLLIALYPLAQRVEWLMILRALHGATGAVFVPALFALVGEYGRANRTGAMGGVGALIGLVALLAPPIGGVIARNYGEPILFWGVAGLMVIAGVAALFLHEPHRPMHPRESTHPLEMWRFPTLRAAYLLTFGMTFTMGVLTFALPVLLQQAGYDAAYRGRLFGLLALVSMALMATLRRGGLLGGALGRALWGVACLTVGALGLSLLAAPTGMWSVVILYGVGFGLTFPAVHLAAFESAPDTRRGVSLALLHSVYSLGYVIGPAAAGIAGASTAGYLGALVGAGTMVAARTWRR